MKKRYFLASIFVTMLMVLSTQVMFFETVKSDPTQHEGDADAGDLWISELDVSSELQAVDKVGIAHVSATDDWVVWTDGSGNINASWSVSFGTRHPEYYVIFSLSIFNVDDQNNEIGNDISSKTYNKDTSSVEGGTLSVALSFTQQQQQMGTQTLVCYLDAQVTINDTIEAKNFTTIATDRCVVAVDFTSDGPQPPPFSTYIRHANELFPPQWSWIYGWDAPSLFSDEDEMLNTQTYFQVGGDVEQPSGGTKIWYLGWLNITLSGWGSDDVSATFTPNMLTANWKKNYPAQNPTWVWGECWINYSISDTPGKDDRPIIMRYKMKSTEQSDVIVTYPETCTKWWWEIFPWADDLDGEIKGRIRSHEDNDDDDDGDMTMLLRVWYRANGAEFPGWADFRFKIHLDPNGGNTDSTSSGTETNWEEACAYVSTCTVGVSNSTSSGITTITVDISNILDESDELVYTFGADTNDERVVLTC